MPRYFFHIVSDTNPVRDARGVELSGLNAAHWHAMHLIYRLRTHAIEAGDDWVVEVSDESGARPLVVLPRSVPLMRHSAQPASRAKGPEAAPLAAKRRLPLPDAGKLG